MSITMNAKKIREVLADRIDECEERMDALSRELAVLRTEHGELVAMAMAYDGDAPTDDQAEANKFLNARDERVAREMLAKVTPF